MKYYSRELKKRYTSHDDGVARAVRYRPIGLRRSIGNTIPVPACWLTKAMPAPSPFPESWCDYTVLKIGKDPQGKTSKGRRTDDAATYFIPRTGGTFTARGRDAGLSQEEAADSADVLRAFDEDRPSYRKLFTDVLKDQP